MARLRRHNTEDDTEEPWLEEQLPAAAASAPAAARPTRCREFRYQQGTSNKFWRIAVTAESVTVTFGRIGTVGQTIIKSYGTPNAPPGKPRSLSRKNCARAIGPGSPTNLRYDERG